MLIIYRTNAPHVGEIISLDFETPAAAMDDYLAKAESGSQMAYLEIELEGARLAELVASVRGMGNRARFRIDTRSSPARLLDGADAIAPSSSAEDVRKALETADTVAKMRDATLKLLGLARPAARDSAVVAEK